MAELSVFLLEIKKELSLEEEPETSCAMKERPKQNLGIHVFFFFFLIVQSVHASLFVGETITLTGKIGLSQTSVLQIFSCKSPPPNLFLAECL